MSNEVSVTMDEQVWHAVLHFELAADDVRLNSDGRAQLGAAADHFETEHGVRRNLRLATLTRGQAKELETWLVAVVARSDAPASARSALTAVREGIRAG